MTKRLREAAEKLAAGEVDKAREELAEFGEKVANLRKKNKLTGAGYRLSPLGWRNSRRSCPAADSSAWPIDGPDTPGDCFVRRLSGHRDW
nr:hypothetical protein [Micromonospora rhizosphaerae]